MRPPPLTKQEMADQCRKASDFAIQLICRSIPDPKKAEQFKNDLRAIQIFNESLPESEQDKRLDERIWLNNSPL